MFSTWMGNFGDAQEYRYPKSNKKKHSWTLLRRMSGLSSLPWLCFSDFNEILYSNKKTGGLDRNANVIAEFSDAVKECKLIDLESRGHPFTWSNRQLGPYCIEEKLDRFFYNQEWRAEFHVDLTTTWSIGSLITIRIWLENGNEVLCMREEISIEFTMRICAAPIRHSKIYWKSSGLSGI